MVALLVSATYTKGVEFSISDSCFFDFLRVKSPEKLFRFEQTKNASTWKMMKR